MIVLSHDRYCTLTRVSENLERTGRLGLGSSVIDDSRSSFEISKSACTTAFEEPAGTHAAETL